MHHEELQGLHERGSLESFYSQVMSLYNSDIPEKQQARKIYELQMPFVKEAHSDMVYGLIKEALSQGILSDEESLESARASREGLYYEEFELEELHAHKLFALQLKQVYKYMNVTRVLDLRWLARLQEVIRTPTSIILVRPSYATTLEDLFKHDPASLITARVVYMLCNAVICLYNYGIAHRRIRPSKVLVNLEPKCQVKLYGFNCMTSYLDQDKFL